VKKLALHVTAVSLLLTGTAAAADLRGPMPVKAPAPAPVVAYNWTGCYVGAGGGYGMFNQETRVIDDGDPFARSNDNGGSGWFGTVQVGCDYQVGSNFVIGAFGDYNFGDNIKGDIVLGGTTVGGEEKLKSSWAVGGRIGWLPFQQLLVFVSAGYTEARFSGVTLFEIEDGSPTPFSLPKQTYKGWFIGTGYEYGIGWLPIQGLFWKTEYRFADYDTKNVAFLFDGLVTADSVDSRKYVHTVRSELVWRFNFGGGPVVARY
jgi:outer membrane immunogenic protein